MEKEIKQKDNYQYGYDSCQEWNIQYLVSWDYYYPLMSKYIWQDEAKKQPAIKGDYFYLKIV